MKRKKCRGMTASHPQIALVSAVLSGVLHGRQDARLPHKQDACATKNFVISWQHDPRDRVAGDASHQCNDRTSGGSIEQL